MSQRNIERILAVDREKVQQLTGVAESKYECPRNGNIVKLQVMY
ncbi:hypothetical protein QUA81_15100 [Microcoleus sp. F6_B4]